MSLEQALEKNTAALVALTAALAAYSHNAAAPKAPAALTDASTVKIAGAPTAPPQKPAPEAGGLSYTAVAKVVTDFVKANGRAPAVLLLEGVAPGHTTIVPFKDKPAELAAIHAAFTDPVKTAAAIAAAKAKA